MGWFNFISVVSISLMGISQPTIFKGSVWNFKIIFPSPIVGFFSFISNLIKFLFIFNFETILLSFRFMSFSLKNFNGVPFMGYLIGSEFEL